MSAQQFRKSAHTKNVAFHVWIDGGLALGYLVRSRQVSHARVGFIHPQVPIAALTIYFNGQASMQRPLDDCGVTTEIG